MELRGRKDQGQRRSSPDRRREGSRPGSNYAGPGTGQAPSLPGAWFNMGSCSLGCPIPHLQPIPPHFRGDSHMVIPSHRQEVL